LVADATDSVIYATPLKGSSLAYLVQNPLDIDFSIEKNVVRKLSPEVVSTKSKKASDFGYLAFGFNIVKTIDLVVSTLVYNPQVKNYELTTASITIIGDGKEIYKGDLKAETNSLVLNGGYEKYKINVSKSNYSSYCKEFTKSQLSNYASELLLIQLILQNNNDMVLVEGGTYAMGDAFGGEYSQDGPIHQVTVNSFYMNKTEIIQKQWKEIMGFNPSYFVGDKRPVDCVSWYQVLVYCNKLSVREGLTPCYSVKGTYDVENWGAIPDSVNNSDWNNVVCNWDANGYRLPTEAEWEYAARGGKSFIYAGSDNIEEVAWYGANSGMKSKEVGLKKANGYGLFDMSGNLHEWCWDWMDSFSNNNQNNPKGPASGYYKCQRGGGWNNVPKTCVVSFRYMIGLVPYHEGINMGFRIVRKK